MTSIRKISLLLLVTALLGGAAWADPIYVEGDDLQGSRSTGNGIVGNGGWDGVGDRGFMLSWSIAQVGSTWHYQYTVSGLEGANLSKALSHIILEVSPVILEAPGDLIWNINHTVSDGPGLFGPSPSNPGLTASFYGIKWDTTGETLTYVLTFDSTQAPIWGDFYAKDGKDGGKWTWAFNAGLGTDPTRNTTDFTNWIPTPDTVTTPPKVPEPGTLTLLGFGLLAGGAWLRRRG